MSRPIYNWGSPPAHAGNITELVVCIFAIRVWGAQNGLTVLTVNSVHFGFGWVSGVEKTYG